MPESARAKLEPVLEQLEAAGYVRRMATVGAGN
jgi:hypothetical protein